MTSIHILGIDLGKHCFHAVAHNYSGKKILRKKYSRNQWHRHSIQRCTLNIVVKEYLVN